MRDSVDFKVTRLEARVPGGMPLVWHGRRICSGPLSFELDDTSTDSGGTMDYARGAVSVAFHVRLRQPGLDAILGIANRSHESIRAVLRAEGEILPDHSFAGGLRGSCMVEPNGMFAAEDMCIQVLPGF